MRERIAVLRGYGLMSCLAAVSVASVLTGCGGSASVQSSPGLSCSNYSLHGAGKYHNEASIRVEISNSTAAPARYAIDVDLTPGGTPSTLVTIHGSLASHASGELSRKVLTAGPIQRCRVTRVTQQSGS
jgi:hypothetical protein